MTAEAERSSRFRIDGTIRVGDVISIGLAVAAALWTVSKISATTDLLGERIDGLRGVVSELKTEIGNGRERDRDQDRRIADTGGRLSALEVWRAEHAKDVEREAGRR